MKPVPYDLVIVGGGIVGLASARELCRRMPQLKLALLDKENRLCAHQSGHNSGVIHAGIYYPPGSLKAKLCVAGLKRTYEYCDEKKLPYKKVGKLIVATNKVEMKRLDNLMERGRQNEVPDLSFANSDEIRQIEPYCRGLKAIYSPQTGIVDWSLVAHQFGKDFTQSGGEICLNYEVDRIVAGKRDTVSIKGKRGESISSKYVIACAGLQADLLAAKSGCSRNPRIVPFRGEYLKLVPEKEYLVKGNIYPVPDPSLPFLGVHFTPRMDGSVWLGPNAVLAYKREGYNKTDINLQELVESVSYRGFRQLAFRHLVPGVQELYRSYNISAQVELLRAFIPELKRKDVVKGPTGVRAQALDEQGRLVDDFIVDQGTGPVGKRVLHVRNAPSPAATSSMAIADLIIDTAETKFGLGK